MIGVTTVKDTLTGELQLLVKQLDVSFVGGRWIGQSADDLNAGKAYHARFWPGSDEYVLTWPKRARNLILTGVRIELGDLRHSHCSSLMFNVECEWPLAERQTTIVGPYPFRLIAAEGARMVGEMLIEVQ